MFAKLHFLFLSAILLPVCVQGQFMENKGQWPEHVLFSCSVGNLTYFIENNGIKVLAIHPNDTFNPHLHEEQINSVRSHSFELTWIGRNPNIKVTHSKPLPGYTNILSGPVDQHVSRIHSFHQITLHEVWEGIDIAFSSDGNKLKYDYIVKPQAQIQDIRILCNGATDIKLINEKIHFITSCGPIIEQVPLSYYLQSDNSRVLVDVFLQLSGNEISFTLEDIEHQAESPLIIDPELISATFVGSIGNPPSQAQAVGCGSDYFIDGSFLGLSIISGTPLNFYPLTVGPYIIDFGLQARLGITRFSSDGSEIIWSSVITLGSIAVPLGSIIDNGSVYLAIGGAQTPNSDSPNALPTNHPSLVPDADDNLISTSNPFLFLVQLSENGDELLNARSISSVRLTMSPQISNGTNSPNNSVAMTTDSQGNLLLCYSGHGENHPITPGAFDTENTADNPDNAMDAVVLKISSDLSELHWCTYFGGDHRDHGLSIIVDEDDNPIIAGISRATSTVNEVQGYTSADDIWFTSKYVGFIVRLSSDGSDVINGTYLDFPWDLENGVSAGLAEVIRFIDFDPEGNIWAYGYGSNNNSDILITEGAYNNPTARGFLCKFSPDLDELLVSTRIGFDPELRYAPTAFMIDNCGYIYTSANSAPPNDGETPGWINNAPLTDDALFDQGGFYLAVYEPDAAGLHYATLMGGDHTDAGYSKFDKKGVVYQAVCVPPFDTGFIPTENAHATEQTFQYELGMFKIDFQSMAATAIMSIDQSEIGDCPPYQLNINNYSTPGEYTVLVNGEVTTFENDQITINAPGEYEIALVVYNPASCNTSDTTSVTLEFQDAPHVVADWEIELSDLCTAGGGTLSATFTGSGAESFNWQSWQGSSQDQDQLTLSFEQPGTYSLELTASESACNTSESLTFEFEYNPFIFDAQALIGDPCQLPVEFNAGFTGQGSSTIEWLVDDLVVANDNSFENTFEQGNYTVTLNAGSENCGAESQQWEVNALGTVEASLSDEVESIFCEGDWLQLEASTNQGSSQWWYNGEVTTGNTLEVNLQNDTHEALFVASDPNSCNLADSVLVSFEVVPAPTAEFELLYIAQPCENELPIELIFTGQNAQSVEWHTGDGAMYTGPDVDHVFESSGLYTISVTALSPPCEPATAQSELNVQLVSEEAYALQFPNIITPNGDGINDCLFFLPSGSNAANISNFSLRIFNRWGALIYESERVAQRWCPQDLTSSTYIYLLDYTDLCTGESFQITRELVVSVRE